MSYNPPRKGAGYVFYIGLVSQSDGQFQANPTLAAGDFKVSKDGGALANLATLPDVDPDASKLVKVTLDSDEMDADNVVVIGSDAAGAEWDDVIVNIQPFVSLAKGTDLTGFNDLSAAQVNAEADTALSDYGALKPTVAGRTLDVTAGGEAGVDWANIGSPTTTLNLSGTTIKTATDVETDTADIQSRIPAALSGDGFIKADLKSIEDELTSGNNAILNLKQLNIKNTNGHALISWSLGGNGHGAWFMGHGLGSGLDLLGGNDQSGLLVDSGSGSTATPAIQVNANNNGPAVQLYSTNNDAIYIEAGNGVSINTPQGIKGSDSEDLSVTNIAAAIPTAAENAAEVLSAATANPIDANVQEINDVTLTGDGSGTPWGPA